MYFLSLLPPLLPPKPDPLPIVHPLINLWRTWRVWIFIIRRYCIFPYFMTVHSNIVYTGFMLGRKESELNCAFIFIVDLYTRFYGNSVVSEVCVCEDGPGHCSCVFITYTVSLNNWKYWKKPFRKSVGVYMHCPIDKLVATFPPSLPLHGSHRVCKFPLFKQCWTRWIRSTSSSPVSLKFVLILSYPLRGRFPSNVVTECVNDQRDAQFL